jgi:hypothetical protein
VLGHLLWLTFVFVPQRATKRHNCASP